MSARRNQTLQTQAINNRHAIAAEECVDNEPECGVASGLADLRLLGLLLLQVLERQATDSALDVHGALVLLLGDRLRLGLLVVATPHLGPTEAGGLQLLVVQLGALVVDERQQLHQRKTKPITKPCRRESDRRARCDSKGDKK